MKKLDISMTEVLPGRPFAVKNLSDLGIRTLKDAITYGTNGLSKAKGLGSCSIDEIEIAALQKGVSIFTRNKAVIFLVWRLVHRYGLTSKFYRPGHPCSYRGEITPGFAHKLAEIVQREGGSITI